jgi:pilus assembly protein FimV
VDSDVIPLDADVDSDVTRLFVVLTPVDSDVMPLEVDVDSDVIALDADVESDVTCAFVAARPVDRELSWVVPSVVSVETDPSSD